MNGLPVDLRVNLKQNYKGTIEYVYDASGNKLKKITTEGSRVIITLYLFGTYVNDTLQFLPHEEGRIRYKEVANEFVFDYFIKDHLGNIRMVLTEEQKQDAYPAATMESALSNVEDSIYYNLTNTRVNKPAGYPSDNYTDPNDKVARTNGSGHKIGPAIVLKVMSGDKFNVKVSSWYKQGKNLPGTPANPLTDLVTALSGGLGSVSGAKVTATELLSNNILNSPVQSFLNSQDGFINNRPKAFLNWILFDEQFQYVSSSSGFDQVGTDQQFKIHQFSGLPINKNGYLYIYVSNETPNIDVFFDNLQVTHVRGSILEETHYYPFGLTMAGISSKAESILQNKKGFNGNELQSKEFSDDSGLELYDFNARIYDPQLGRFIQVDPMSEEGDQESWGPFGFGYDNPVRYNDPDGRCPCLLPFLIPALKAATAAVVAYVVVDANEENINQIADNVGSYLNDRVNSSSKSNSSNENNSNDKNKFGGENSTSSQNSNQALNKAKDQNSIPRSQQPDRTIKPNTKKGDAAGLDKRNVKQYEYTNSKGEKITIRQDKEANYPDGGKQGTHFNAGKSGQPLKQHHYYKKQAVKATIFIVKLINLF